MIVDACAIGVRACVLVLSAMHVGVFFAARGVLLFFLHVLGCRLQDVLLVCLLTASVFRGFI